MLQVSRPPSKCLAQVFALTHYGICFVAQDKKRFEIELEFVQCLANVEYLQRKLSVACYVN